jgi:hypothetical protein
MFFNRVAISFARDFLSYPVAAGLQSASAARISSAVSALFPFQSFGNFQDNRDNDISLMSINAVGRDNSEQDIPERSETRTFRRRKW